MYRVLTHHKKEYGCEPEVVVDVPGVTTILGTFAELCDGYALMCTNDQGLRLAISRRQDSTVKVYNYTIQDRKRFQLSGLKCKPEDKWIGTVKGIFIALQHDGVQLPGMDISITGRTAHSDYDTLASAVAAGFLFGLNELLDLKYDIHDMLRIAHASNAYSVGSSRLRDLLTLFVINRKELVLFDLDNYSYEKMENPFDNETITSYILDCGMPRNILAEEEENLHLEMRSALQKLKANVVKSGHLRDYSLRELKFQRSFLTEEDMRFASFAIKESQLVLRAWDALKQKDRDRFCKVLAEQQVGIAEYLDFTCPEMEWMHKRCAENPHVFVSCLVYTGIITGNLLVIGENNLNVYHNERLNEYEHIFDFKATLRHFSPTGGVRILKDDADIIG